MGERESGVSNWADMDLGTGVGGTVGLKWAEIWGKFSRDHGSYMAIGASLQM